MKTNLPYRAIWVLDFKFVAQDGEHPEPVCMAAYDVVSERWAVRWTDELTAPIFDCGPDCLYVAYGAAAEWSCFLQLDWSIPTRCIDLFAEFVCIHNGSASERLYPSLIAAAAHYGIGTTGTMHKKAMRDLILKGVTWSDAERAEITHYCASDVLITTALFHAMLPEISASTPRLGQALLRGRYTCAVARMERTGIPADVVTLDRLKIGWGCIKQTLVATVDSDYGVFIGTSFNAALFSGFLQRTQIPWPRLSSGKPALDDDTFRERARSYPEIAALYELRRSLAKMHVADISVGSDGRMRTGLRPFSSRTGRNQPSNAKFIFGPSRWLRGLIKPRPGRALAYVDWSSQEIAIAAALSNDDAMWEAYATGDPYLSFSKQIGLVPLDATKQTHKTERQRVKVVVLGIGYGMKAESIAQQAGIHIEEARTLLRYHRKTYHVFWEWVAANQNAGLLGFALQTTFGWSWRSGQGTTINPRSLLNWPIQSSGAEMMRLACCELSEMGVQVCAPIHDALLVEASMSEIDLVAEKTKAAMERAGELVLGKGRIVRTDSEIVRYPARYLDESGFCFWNQVMGLLDKSGI